MSLLVHISYGQAKPTVKSQSSRPFLTVEQIANCNNTPALWPKYHGAILYGWPYYFKDIDIDVNNKTHYEHIEYYTNIITKQKTAIEYRQIKKGTDEYSGLLLECDRNGNPVSVIYWENQTNKRYEIYYNELGKPVKFYAYDSSELNHGTWVEHENSDCYTGRKVTRYQHGQPLFQYILDCNNKVITYDTLVSAWGGFLRPKTMTTDEIETSIGMYGDKLKQGKADSTNDRNCILALQAELNLRQKK